MEAFMGGFFGVVSKKDCVFGLFFGVDYHSHLGTRRGGMAVLGENGFNRSIHNIENSPFRTKFEKDVDAKAALGMKSNQLLYDWMEGVAPSAKYLQEAIITQRDGRYVVPLKAEHKGQINGILHDTSSIKFSSIRYEITF